MHPLDEHRPPRRRARCPAASTIPPRNGEIRAQFWGRQWRRRV